MIGGQTTGLAISDFKVWAALSAYWPKKLLVFVKHLASIGGSVVDVVMKVSGVVLVGDGGGPQRSWLGIPM